ncbi:MAG: phosphatase PAP2 family protein [Ruminococcaceae bacterium]|nr:phosphatase PAP2 family protein [Oscillospiraceae bacterium]
MITQWDLSVLDAIASLRTPFLDNFFSAVTHLGDTGIVWIVLALILLCIRKTRPLGVCMALALIFDLLLCNMILKPLVGRIRPYELREVALLIKAPHDASFPSGHTAVSFAAAGVVALRRSKLAIPALILASIIAFSRLYLYVHFPTDVLGGILVGMICALLGCSFGSRLCKKLRWED